jgi:cholesterol transport system auxiliary component
MNYFALLFLLLASCSITPKQPLTHDFGVAISKDAYTAIPQSVSVDAPKWLWDKGIRYRLTYKSPTQIDVYALDRWLAAPPELFEQLLTKNASEQDYSLVIQLQDFEQQFSALTQAKVLLRFKAELYGKEKNKLKSKEFYLEKTTNSPDAAGAVKGFANLTREAVKQLDNWLNQK